jgi:hypothetical protein
MESEHQLDLRDIKKKDRPFDPKPQNLTSCAYLTNKQGSDIIHKG